MQLPEFQDQFISQIDENNESDIKGCLLAAQMVKCPLPAIPTPTGNVFVLSKSDRYHILYIPDEVRRLPDNFKLYTYQLRGTIVIKGGHNLDYYSKQMISD